ncbi:MAG TPA: LLM class flavin-dependent oxidoreductase [Bryobacteraceae bacterium]|nr:LLM class flavin-dependent oxidoreductase [Bryobacteraceae bacterium]
MPPFALSVLDQSPIPEGSTAGDALHNSIDLARRADELGYRRFWLAEHHGTSGLACASPEALIGPVAAATSQIRVGSGGIMLPHYSPLKVAETFSMLSGLFPGRIDLGIGRAPGTSAHVAFALQRDRRQPAPDDFRDQLEELLGYFGKRPSPPSPFRQLPSLRFVSPEVSLLGSSAQSAIWAAELGLPYVFADFINPQGAPMAAYYREHFTPSPLLDSPRTGVAVWALCAESDAEALRLSASFRMMMLMLFRGRPIPVPAVERAEEFLEQEGLPLDELPAGRRIITGAPATVRTAIEAVADEYSASEVFVVNIMHDHTARRRSYELIAEAFSQTRPAAP